MVAPSPLIVIVGETASGKSSLGLELARQFDGEIINADSWQIYKGMNVGTAKPSGEEMQEIPHHLVDIISPKEDFTAAVYKKLAQSAIENVSERGKLPILVGGTGLYIDSILFDYSFAPEGESKLRQQLNGKTITELLDIIEERRLDLTAIDICNKRRLVRLIETDGFVPEKSELRGNTLILGVKISRTKLRENIEKRVEQMFRHGLKHEARELAEQYGWDVEAMKGIGYREFKSYFDGEQSLAETKRKIVRSTIGLAKKQRTWFKRNKSIQWIDNRDQAVALTTTFLSKLNK